MLHLVSRCRYDGIKAKQDADIAKLEEEAKATKFQYDADIEVVRRIMAKQDVDIANLETEAGIARRFKKTQDAEIARMECELGPSGMSSQEPIRPRYSEDA